MVKIYPNNTTIYTESLILWKLTKRSAWYAAIFKVDMWDLLKSSNNGMVLQINEGDSGGDIALYASSDMAMKLELLNQELKHCREMLEQKDKEIELLRQLATSVQK